MKKKLILILIVAALCAAAGLTYYFTHRPTDIEGTDITFVFANGGEITEVTYRATKSTLGATLADMAAEGKINGFSVTLGYVSAAQGIENPIIRINSDSAELVLLGDDWLQPIQYKGVTFNPIALSVDEIPIYEGAVYHFMPYTQ